MLDISFVTDKLKQLLNDAIAASPIWTPPGPNFSWNVSGVTPQETEHHHVYDCDLNLYLFHITEDKYLKNSFWTQQNVTGQPSGPKRQPIAFEPLCLDLYYLLSAHSAKTYSFEQQLMSVAMRCFHENPTILLNDQDPNGDAQTEITVTMETPSQSEISTLWQGLATPLRMAVQYRASVVFITPRTALAAQPKPKVWTVLADAPAPVAAIPNDPKSPALIATFRRVGYLAPAGPPVRTFDLSPATTGPAPAAPDPTGPDPAGDQRFVLRGTNIAETDLIYLVAIDAAGTETEADVTDWKVALVHPYGTDPDGGVAVELRPTAGGCPTPGRYYLRVGRPADVGWRSNLVALDVAPWLDPSGGAVLVSAGGVFSCTAVNVPATGVEVRLGTAPLTRVTASTPGLGEWSIAGTALALVPPPNLAPGEYALRLRAANVEADPALWVTVP